MQPVGHKACRGQVRASEICEDFDESFRREAANRGHGEVVVVGSEVVTGSAGSAINRLGADKASISPTQRINPGAAMTPAQSRISGFDERVTDICFHVR